jgi:DNA-directed RNA polymerase specialized sigma24 family protein
MTVTPSFEREPDRCAVLLAGLMSGDLDRSDAQELAARVHQAIHPMCLAILGDRDAAADAEQETWRRILQHLRRCDPAALRITNGVAYVRAVAARVGRELRAARAARHRPPRCGPDVAAPQEPDAPSPDVTDDLAALLPHERLLLSLRADGASYREIAERLGGTLSPALVQRQSERALLDLRGRVHVRVWQQRPLGQWPVPSCPELTELMAEVQQRLAAGRSITTTLYRDIGRHLDPNPDGAARACRTCRTNPGRPS